MIQFEVRDKATGQVRQIVTVSRHMDYDRWTPPEDWPPVEMVIVAQTEEDS